MYRDDDRGWLMRRAVEMRRDHVDAEGIVWSRVRRRQLDGYRFRRQHVVGRAILDLYCAEKRLAVEIDGPTHDEVKDARRDLLLARCGIEVLRVTNEDVYEDLEGVLALIVERLNARVSYRRASERTRITRASPRS